MSDKATCEGTGGTVIGNAGDYCVSNEYCCSAPPPNSCANNSTSNQLQYCAGANTSCQGEAGTGSCNTGHCCKQASCGNASATITAVGSDGKTYGLPHSACRSTDSHNDGCNDDEKSISDIAANNIDIAYCLGDNNCCNKPLCSATVTTNCVCPVGQVNPHYACSGTTCAPIQSCGTDSCTAGDNSTCSNPKPTVAPNHTVLNLTVGLDGVGHIGDQANPDWTSKYNAAGSNQNPLTNPRTFTVNVGGTNYNASLTYDKTTGVYKGTADLGTTFNTDDYLIKISSPSHLVKAVAGTVSGGKVHIVAGVSTNTVPQVNLVTGDIQGTNSLTVVDYTILISCLKDPDINDFDNQVTCKKDPSYLKLSNLEDNGVNGVGVVDKYDYNLFIREFSKVQQGD